MTMRELAGSRLRGQEPPPATDRDVLLSARQLIERHGQKAPVQAARQAERFMIEGARSEFDVWFRIMRAAIEMLRTEPRDGEAVN